MKAVVIEKLERRIEKVNSLVCVGLDADDEKLPKRFGMGKQPQWEFNKWIIDQTVSCVCAFKPNLAFYEARGEAGWRELWLTMEYLRSEYPDVVTIADAKRADIGSTNVGYVKAIFDELGFDAVTLHPYLGREALMPFLEREDKAVIILCRTSNPGAGEFQDLNTKCQKSKTKNGKEEFIPLWRVVAERVSREWNEKGNCMLVVGATYPEELGVVRKVVGEMPMLVPGVGTQGGDVRAVMKVGLDEDNRGLIINSARGIIFAEDPVKEARELRDQINQYR